jgi:hypothetical protein
MKHAATDQRGMLPPQKRLLGSPFFVLVLGMQRPDTLPPWNVHTFNGTQASRMFNMSEQCFHMYNFLLGCQHFHVLAPDVPQPVEQQIREFTENGGDQAISFTILMQWATKSQLPETSHDVKLK